jgi:hypothetical protein
MPRKSQAVKDAEADIKAKEAEMKPLRKRAKAGEKKIEKLKATLAKQATKHKAEAEKIRTKAKAFHEKADAMQAKKMAKYYGMLDHAKHLDMLAHAKERASKAKVDDMEKFKDEINEHAKRIDEIKASMKTKKGEAKAEAPMAEEMKEEKIEIVVPEMKKKEFPAKALEGLRKVEAETKERNVSRKAQMVKGSKEAMEFGQRMKEAKKAKKAPEKKMTRVEMIRASEKKEVDTSKAGEIPDDIKDFKKGLKGKFSKEAIEKAFEQAKGKAVSVSKLNKTVDLLEKALKRDEKESKEAPTDERRKFAKESLPGIKLNIEATKAMIDFIENA